LVEFLDEPALLGARFVKVAGRPNDSSDPQGDSGKLGQNRPFHVLWQADKGRCQ
jgi:hypothetical protein